MATYEKIQLWHCVTVFVIRDNSTAFILLRRSGASLTIYPLMLDSVGERWRDFVFSEFDRSSERHSLHNNTSSRGLTYVSGDKTNSFSRISFAVY
jgi:hypothetical protein